MMWRYSHRAHIEFGKPVAWLGLLPPEAIEFAHLILKNCGIKISDA